MIAGDVTTDDDAFAGVEGGASSCGVRTLSSAWGRTTGSAQRRTCVRCDCEDDGPVLSCSTDVVGSGRLVNARPRKLSESRGERVLEGGRGSSFWLSRCAVPRESCESVKWRDSNCALRRRTTPRGAEARGGELSSGIESGLRGIGGLGGGSRSTKALSTGGGLRERWLSRYCLMAERGGGSSRLICGTWYPCIRLNDFVGGSDGCCSWVSCSGSGSWSALVREIRA